MWAISILLCAQYKHVLNIKFLTDALTDKFYKKDSSQFAGGMNICGKNHKCTCIPKMWKEGTGDKQYDNSMS